MSDKRPKHDQHNPSQNSLQRWDNEGGATKRSRAKHPRDFSQADKLVGDISTGRVENRPPTPEEQGKDLAAVPDNLGARKAEDLARQRFQSRNAKRLARSPLKLIGKPRGHRE